MSLKKTYVGLLTKISFQFILKLNQAPVERLDHVHVFA